MKATLVRPKWDSILRYAHHRSSYCSVCHAIITSEKALQKCWMAGHFDGLTEADCSEPAPSYAPAFVPAQGVRLLLFLFTLAGIVAGVLIGSGITRLLLK